MENTARNFALQLGSLISLYVSITALTMLLFSIISIQYPDPAQGAFEYESASMNLRMAVALLIVFFPTFVVLTRIVNKIRRSESGVYLTLMKWLVYLSLVVGGAVLLGDLVATVNSYLNGELSIRFALKALSLFAVVGTAFVYYLYDVRGYWQTHEKHSIQYAGVVSGFVLIILILGLMKGETPQNVREVRLDQAQVNDLSLMQNNVDAYAYEMRTLPNTLAEAFRGSEVPQAPEGRAQYSYRKISANTYSLCATFLQPSTRSEQMQYTDVSYAPDGLVKGVRTWTHGAGETCFERSVVLSDGTDTVPVGVPQKK